MSSKATPYPTAINNPSGVRDVLDGGFSPLTFADPGFRRGSALYRMGGAERKILLHVLPFFCIYRDGMQH